MMKNKMIMVLLFAAAGFGQDAQAMGGAARKLAQSFSRAKQSINVGVKFICSEYPKTSFVAGQIVSGGAKVIATYAIAMPAVLYYVEKADCDRQERERLTPLAPEVEEKIKAFFGKYGFYPEINNTVDLTGVRKDGNETELFLSQFDRFILTYGRLDVCRGTKRVTLEEKHVWVVLGHEVDHLIHHDSDKDCEISEMDWVTSSSFMRKIEERCDRNAAFNLAGRDADPEVLAQLNEDAAHYLKFMIPLEEQMLKRMKPFADEKKVTCEELMDHPLCSVRFDYLTELAAEFRRKNTLTFKVGAFVRQQRAELGKLFRGELKK